MEAGEVCVHPANKGNLISQKGGRRPTSLSQSQRQSLLFNAKQMQNILAYTP